MFLFFHSRVQMVEEWKVRRAAEAASLPVSLGSGAGVGVCEDERAGPRLSEGIVIAGGATGVASAVQASDAAA